ncbi:hypothetical protein ACOSQ3_023382 [Xanthoceras sorbifolium]
MPDPNVELDHITLDPPEFWFGYYSETIAELYALLHLSDDEGPVQRVRGGGGSLKEDGSRKMSLCLVGKLLAIRQTNKEAFRVLIPKIWRTNHEVSVELVQNNIFSFHFNDMINKKKVMSSGPWNFDNSLLVLENQRDKEIFLKWSLLRLICLVQIHNVILLCMTHDCSLLLGFKIGKVTDIDLGASKDYVGRFIWCLSNNSAQAVGVIRDHKFGGWLRATSALRDCFSNPRRSTWSSKVDVPISSVHREEHSGDATQNPVEDSHGFDRIIADIVTVGSLATGKDKTVTSVEEIELQLIRYPILRRLLLDIHVRYFLPLMILILNPLLSSNSSM